MNSEYYELKPRRGDSHIASRTKTSGQARGFNPGCKIVNYITAEQRAMFGVSNNVEAVILRVKITNQATITMQKSLTLNSAAWTNSTMCSRS